MQLPLEAIFVTTLGSRLSVRAFSTINIYSPANGCLAAVNRKRRLAVTNCNLRAVYLVRFENYETCACCGCGKLAYESARRSLSACCNNSASKAVARLPTVAKFKRNVRLTTQYGYVRTSKQHFNGNQRH